MKVFTSRARAEEQSTCDCVACNEHGCKAIDASAVFLFGFCGESARSHMKDLEHLSFQHRMDTLSGSRQS